MADTQYITAEKRESLEAELNDIKTVKIHAIAKRIDEARQMGDLSENAEYHAAREEMSWTQSRMKEVEFILNNAEIIADTGSSCTVQIGSSISVKVNGKEKEYTIVGAQEADPLEGKISNESPIGMAFLGKKKGDKVEVETPAGVQEYKITALK